MDSPVDEKIEDIQTPTDPGIENIPMTKNIKDEEAIREELLLDSQKIEQLSKQFNDMKENKWKESTVTVPGPSYDELSPSGLEAQIPSYKYEEMGVSEMIQSCKEFIDVCCKMAEVCPKITATFQKIAKIYPERVVVLRQLEATPLRMFTVALELLSHTKRLERAIISDPLSVVKYDYCKANVDLNNRQLILLCEILMKEFTHVVGLLTKNNEVKSLYHAEILKEIKLSCEQLKPVTEELKKAGLKMENFSLDNVKSKKLYPTNYDESEKSIDRTSLLPNIVRCFTKRRLDKIVTYILVLIFLITLVLQVYVVFLYVTKSPTVEDSKPIIP